MSDSLKIGERIKQTVPLRTTNPEQILDIRIADAIKDLYSKEIKITTVIE